MGEAEAKLTLKEKIRVWAVTNAHGPFAVPALVLLSFTESIFFPIPTDTLLIPLVIIRARHWFSYAFIAAVASVLGGIAGYAVGFFLFALIGDCIITFYGLESETELVKTWLAEHAFWATFISAFTPIPYKVFTISAGLLNAPFLVFVAASLLGRSLRYVIVAWLAHMCGPVLARLALKHFTVATITLALIAIFVLIAL
jgi:membrane protein YqaA with SNARE-associated domain